MKPPKTFTVATTIGTARLDAFLTQQLPEVSRRSARQLIDGGAVRVNGRRVVKSYALAPGDVVAIDAEAPLALHPTPNPKLSILVLYEDTHVLALDKPAGIPTHSLNAQEAGTVASFLAARFPECLATAPEVREAGIVHRLDNDTSGVLLVARTSLAYEHLRRQFDTRRVVKEYTALVHGRVEAEGRIQRAIAHAKRDGRRMRVTDEGTTGSREAITAYRPIEFIRGFTRLTVEIETGARHQIRVHLAAIGHPIVGDRLYGPMEWADTSVSRHLLHASFLRFRHPERRVDIEVRSGLPDDFTAAMRKFTGRRPPHR